MRILIVDDEAHARERLRRLLSADTSVTIVGECASGADAVAAVAALAPDVMLLDIQMPELDGFGVVRTIPADSLPLVIFVTAFEQHALTAFDVEAVDYLLKPVEAFRLQSALTRARARLDGGGAGRDPGDDRMLVRHAGNMYPVRRGDILWVQAEGNYAQLHLAGRHFLVRETMTNLEKRLGPQFARIHRSAIVNLDAIAELQPWFGGDLVLILTTGARLRVSRHFKERLDRWVLG